ncbi:hypothetical protein [Paraburkholderia sp. DGU8]|uniref:hypothetical protein n=1 Tax=Paraburkholderia sp. DGU8 TaxID=3161997 RepID=UPI00346557DA
MTNNSAATPARALHLVHMPTSDIQRASNFSACAEQTFEGRKMRKTGQILMLGTAALIVSAQAAHSQQVPPACEQYVRAMDACSKNAIRFFERTDPDSAEKIRQQNAGPTLENMFKRAVEKNGALDVAKRCVDPQIKQTMLTQVTNVVTILGMNQALDQNCLNAMNAIR